MPNYATSSIYKICSINTEIKDIYVGSTTNFTKRKQLHKARCNNTNIYNSNVYKFIRKNGGWDAWCMIEIEKYTATDKRHLETRERYWIETLCAKLNNNIPTRGPSEGFKVWYEENKEAMLNKRKQVRNENKAIGKSIYQEKKAHKKTRINCIHCGSTTTYQSKSRHEKTNKCIYNQIYNFIHS